jgi:hypothetical protein
MRSLVGSKHPNEKKKLIRLFCIGRCNSFYAKKKTTKDTLEAWKVLYVCV